MELLEEIVAGAGLTGLVAYFRFFWRRRLVLLGNGDGSYIRLFPNPGVTVRGKHYCKNKGRH